MALITPAIRRLWSAGRCAVHHLNNRRAAPRRAAAAKQRRWGGSAFLQTVLRDLTAFTAPFPLSLLPAECLVTAAEQEHRVLCTRAALCGAAEHPSVATKWEAQDGVPWKSDSGPPLPPRAPLPAGSGFVVHPTSHTTVSRPSHKLLHHLLGNVQLVSCLKPVGACKPMLSGSIAFPEGSEVHPISSF